MTSADPKHGRWILPLIIMAMGALTWTFVNSLEPAQSPVDAVTSTSSTLLPSVTTTTDPTATTSTLPPEGAELLVDLDLLQTRANGFGRDVTSINDDWENRSTTGETLNSTAGRFEETRNAIQLWEQSVVDLQVPTELEAQKAALIKEAGELPVAVDDIVAGLRAPDDGSLRREAVGLFGDELAQVISAVETLRTDARSLFAAP